MTGRRIVLVTGLSGAGRASILRALEDLGYEAVDNPPLTLAEELAARGDRPLAIGMDARSRGFDGGAVLAVLERLRLNPALRPELVFAVADTTVLLRRFTETRRRHPLAPGGPVVDGIAREAAMLSGLAEMADLVIDTSDMPVPALRRLVEQRFGGVAASGTGLTVSLMSFGYPRGLPREADLVFDARFLRNPHYDPQLKPRTGHDPAVAAHVEADPDFFEYFGRIESMLRLLLPRFVQEGKKYLTVAVGCTGGRHRSVCIVEKLARRLSAPAGADPDGEVDGRYLDRRAWQVTVAHRELARDEAVGSGGTRSTDTFQAQEA